MNESSILDLATQELPDALAALDAGDESIQRYVRSVRQLLDGVNGKSREALIRAETLRNDDVMNPEGKRRQLRELPDSLVTSTADQLEQADLILDLIEGAHLAAILKHDHRDDANLRFELSNFTAAMTKENAVASMVELAANPRYSTILAGPVGISLAARFGFRPEILREAALRGLAIDGTADQKARLAALAGMKDGARRALGLSRGARDFAIDAIRKPMAPNPSEPVGPARNPRSQA